jgi:hypothetical protein
MPGKMCWKAEWLYSKIMYFVFVMNKIELRNKKTWKLFEDSSYMVWQRRKLYCLWSPICEPQFQHIDVTLLHICTFCSHNHIPCTFCSHNHIPCTFCSHNHIPCTFCSHNHIPCICSLILQWIWQVPSVDQCAPADTSEPHARRTNSVGIQGKPWTRSQLSGGCEDCVGQGDQLACHRKCHTQ